MATGALNTPSVAYHGARVLSPEPVLSRGDEAGRYAIAFEITQAGENPVGVVRHLLFLWIRVGRCLSVIDTVQTSLFLPAGLHESELDALTQIASDRLARCTAPAG
jgi:hypothetical protein